MLLCWTRQEASVRDGVCGDNGIWSLCLDAFLANSSCGELYLSCYYTAYIPLVHRSSNSSSDLEKIDSGRLGFSFPLEDSHERSKDISINLHFL
jgi:hypothetical protein